MNLSVLANSHVPVTKSALILVKTCKHGPGRSLPVMHLQGHLHSTARTFGLKKQAADDTFDWLPVSCTTNNDLPIPRIRLCHQWINLWLENHRPKTFPGDSPATTPKAPRVSKCWYTNGSTVKNADGFELENPDVRNRVSPTYCSTNCPSYDVLVSLMETRCSANSAIQFDHDPCGKIRAKMVFHDPELVEFSHKFHNYGNMWLFSHVFPFIWANYNNSQTRIVRS